MKDKNVNPELGKMIFKKGTNLKHFFVMSFGRLVSTLLAKFIEIPKWVRLGISSVSIDKFFGYQTVKKKTIAMLINENKPYNVNSINVESNNEFAYYYSKGYWTVRYLEEEYPGFLKEVINNYEGEQIENQIIKKLNLDKEKYWEQLDELLYKSYKYLLAQVS